MGNTKKKKKTCKPWELKESLEKRKWWNEIVYPLNKHHGGVLIFLIYKKKTNLNEERESVCMVWKHSAKQI